MHAWLVLSASKMPISTSTGVPGCYKQPVHCFRRTAIDAETGILVSTLFLISTCPKALETPSSESDAEMSSSVVRVRQTRTQVRVSELLPNVHSRPVPAVAGIIPRQRSSSVPELQRRTRVRLSETLPVIRLSEQPSFGGSWHARLLAAPRMSCCLSSLVRDCADVLM